MDHGERYRRAREFFDVVTGLWDSWADDAFIRDVEEGVSFDPERLHVLEHKGEFVSVRGPLNIARPIKAGQSSSRPAGRHLAAEPAEMIFASGGNLADAQRFYGDVKGRMEMLGRSRLSENPSRRPCCRRRRDRRRGAGEASIARQPRASG